MKNKIFFTNRPFSRVSLLGSACAAMIMGAALLFPGANAFAQSEDARENEPATGLQIYRDEDGNRVMRTTPAPQPDQGGSDTYYIAPQIYPEMWGTDHRPGHRPDWRPPHSPGMHPQPGKYYEHGKYPGKIHPGVSPHP